MADDKRLFVLNLSIFIERFVSNALAGLLDIDAKESKTLGNKSSAFSFRQKLDLLTDIRVTDKDAVKRFQVFAEIRNQFAHNFDVNDFQSCFSYLDGVEKFLRNIYKIDGLEKHSNEEQLQILYNYLFNDILNHSHNILEKLEERLISKGRDEGSKQVYEFVFKEINELSKTDSDFREKYSKIISEAEKRFSDNE